VNVSCDQKNLSDVNSRSFFDRTVQTGNEIKALGAIVCVNIERDKFITLRFYRQFSLYVGPSQC
jgi:hypothetical protein